MVSVLSVIRDDMMGVAAEAEDIAFIRGAGNQFEPLGIGNTPGINTFAQTGTGHQEKTDDLVDAENNVENAKIRVRSGAWYMSVRTKGGLLKTLTADGAQAFRTEMVVNGTLNGWPFGATTAIPTNLGGGTESELYFVESRMLMIGETLRMELSEHEGSYNDGSTQRNTVQRDERVLRLIHEVDSALRRPEAATKVTGITY